MRIINYLKCVSFIINGNLLLVLLLLILTFVGCSQQKLNQQVNPVDSKSTEIYTTSNTGSKKKIITIEDIEKLFASQNLSLDRKDVEQSDFNRLMQEYPIEYYLNGGKSQVLKVYVFNSKDERTKARKEHNNKIATMNLPWKSSVLFTAVSLELHPVKLDTLIAKWSFLTEHNPFN